MIVGLKPKKELLLSVIPQNSGETAISYAQVSNRSILKAGEGLPSKTDVPLRAAVFSADSYFDQAELSAPSTKMLPLIARRYVDGELAFQDDPYRLRAISLTKRERTIYADVSALPEADVEAALAALPVLKVPCQQLVPMELSIAALMKDVTKEPVIVFWEKTGFLVSLLILDGLVQGRMCERIADSNRDMVMARAEASLRSTATRLGEHRDLFLVIHTGDLRDHTFENRDKASLAFEDKLCNQFKTGKKAPKDSVLRHPEVFGLPLVDEKWTFVDEGYRDEVRAWRYSKPVAAAASIVGILFALYGAVQHMQAFALGYKFDAKRADLTKTLSDIDAIRPSDDEMQTVRDGLKVQSQSVDEVRLDKLLAWLTHLVPEGVVISSLDVVPSPPPDPGRKLRAATYQPGHRPFLVNLEIVLADTTFDAAESSSAEIVKRLSQRLQMVHTRLDVPAPEPGVRRNVVLVANAHARAVDF